MPATKGAKVRNSGRKRELIAASHRGLVERVLLGSFAGYLVRHAPCAVLLTRPPEASSKKH